MGQEYLNDQKCAKWPRRFKKVHKWCRVIRNESSDLGVYLMDQAQLNGPSVPNGSVSKWA